MYRYDDHDTHALMLYDHISTRVRRTIEGFAPLFEQLTSI